MLSDKQLSFIAHSDAFLNLADGSVRSGKTHSALRRFAEMCIQGPPGDFMVMGKTERTIKRNVILELSRLLPKGTVRYVQGAGELYVFGRLCWVIGANDVRAEEKVRGLTSAGGYLNEATLYPENIFQTTIDRHSVDGAQILGDMNPDSPYHYLYKNFLTADKSKDFLKRWRFRLEDNPGLSERYKNMLIEAHPPGTLWHKRMVLGEWVVAEGAVYDQFDPEVHVVKELPERFERVVVGIDYGTSNPTAFIALGLHRDTWYAFSERRHEGAASGRQRTDAEHSRDLQEFLWSLKVTPTSIEVDPSAASFKAQIRQDGVRRVKGADHAVIDGIRVVSTGLSNETLKIHESCERLIEEFTMYSWDEKAQERGEDKPIKENDHSLDALRYAAMRALNRPALSVVKKPVGF